MGINSHGRDWEWDLNPLFWDLRDYEWELNPMVGTGNGT